MGIKEKLGKLASSVNLDSAINSVLEKTEKAAGRKNSDEYITKLITTKKKGLVIKTRTHSISSLTKLSNGGLPEDFLGRYKVYDLEGKLHYTAKSQSNISDREIIDLYDAHQQKIGTVKQHLISTGIPLLEKEVKKCTVQNHTNNITFEVKGYESFGERSIDLYSDMYNLRENDMDYVIQKKSKNIATLHRVSRKFNEGYSDRYIMEYNSPEEIATSLLITIAIDIVK